MTREFLIEILESNPDNKIELYWHTDGKLEIIQKPALESQHELQVLICEVTKRIVEVCREFEKVKVEVTKVN